jgi:hypothetical protein
VRLSSSRRGSVVRAVTPPVGFETLFVGDTRRLTAVWATRRGAVGRVRVHLKNIVSPQVSPQPVPGVISDPPAYSTDYGAWPGDT